ncbi:OmpA family protein [Hyphococcus sp.]|uniref:OmpA family protein n=1 Tax=Hyphococcus sp. TaxID=2038636 RepID=UPI003D114561
MAKGNQSADEVKIRIKRKIHRGHEDEAHSGVWKMVYADFTTAMMAFFLVLWLATTASESQRDLLADYFNPVAVSRNKSGADGVLGGRSADEKEGALLAPGAPDISSLPVAAPPVLAEMGDEMHPPHVGVEMSPQKDATRFSGSDGDLEEQLKALEDRLRLAIALKTDALGLEDVIIIERRTDAVYIQIVEDVAFSMFETGSANLKPEAEILFNIVGAVLTTIPNTIRVLGHTDAAGFTASGKAGNWELSSSRANAARRVLERAGLPQDRIEAVEGRADRELLFPAAPLDARNRRITISVHANVSPSSDLLFKTEQRGRR